MGHLYGDSTPFPYGADFIETIRHAVDTGVLLLAAQEAMARAAQRSDSDERHRQETRSRVVALSDALTSTLSFHATPTVVRSSTRIRETAQAIIAAEISALEGQASATRSSSLAAIEAARQGAFCALESFVLRHDLPQTEVGLHLTAGESTYFGEALVNTPFGVEAVFELAIPAAHDWGRPRRVVEMSAATEVHLPIESGFFSKRIETRLVKLDRLYISEVALSDKHTLITLRKGPRSGSGYHLEVTPGESTATMHVLDENGQPGPEGPLQIDGDDSVHLLRLWNRVTDTTRDLPMRRQAMTEATFEGTPVRELQKPRIVAERLVKVMAPIVQEIGRRSGAPGELVLRRDVGEGRREEVYITKAELEERVLELPEELREVFDPFDLREGPRSPRAPAHSERIIVDSGLLQEIKLEEDD